MPPSAYSVPSPFTKLYALVGCGVVVVRVLMLPPPPLSGARSDEASDTLDASAVEAAPADNEAGVDKEADKEVVGPLWERSSGPMPSSERGSGPKRHEPSAEAASMARMRSTSKGVVARHVAITWLES